LFSLAADSLSDCTLPMLTAVTTGELCVLSKGGAHHVLCVMRIVMGIVWERV